MRHSLASVLAPLVIALSLSSIVPSQSSTGTISGTVADQNRAVVPGATVLAKNTLTGFTRSSVTDSSGRYRFSEIPTGTYDLSIEAANFSGYRQSGITLDASQNAIVDVTLRAGNISERVTINENASLLNSTTVELSTRFDSRRLSELPSSPNRSVYNVLLSTPGVSQPAGGQTAMALGISFSSNGGRIRSNSFLLDGQDINDSALTGGQIPLNNPDAIQEVRIVTGQFLPEYGHNSGSVANFVGKSGTNDFHGSLFWFHNNENLNACSNTDRDAGYCAGADSSGVKKKAPIRRENQFGFTLGGPVILPRFGEDERRFYSGRDKTFFFADSQRWSDRRSPSLTLSGAPTEAGRNLLQTNFGNRLHVQELLRSVPAGVPNGGVSSVSLPNGSTVAVPLGDVTGTSDFKFKSDQGSIRIDHRLSENNLVYGRYRYSYESTRGAGQIVPEGLGTVANGNAHAAAMVWTALLTPYLSNEARVAWKRFDLARERQNPTSTSIPSIQILDLGMSGLFENDRRTAFGHPSNLPVFRVNDTYQLTEAISFAKARHSFKLGVEWRRSKEKDLLFFGAHGSLIYTNLSNFVNDIAQLATKSLPMPGSDVTQLYRWNEFYAYAQDQWQILPNLTLSYGVRYEYPGDTFGYLRDLNARILTANGSNRALRFMGVSRSDTGNWMPRVGFNWNPRTSGKGLPGLITGGSRLVVRGGYARAYDAHPVNINQNIFASFPFTASHSFSQLSSAYTLITGLTTPTLSNLTLFTRGTVASDFRAPATDQFSLDIQRELEADLVFRIGYVRTRGTGLFQVVDGNPRLPCPFGTGLGTCNTTGINRNTGLPLPPGPPVLNPRVDLTMGPVTLRANSASSVYDALQASLEKRLSRGVSFGLHYTWSAFLDSTSDVNAVSPTESSFAQDPYNRDLDWARSAYDRPHRVSGNIVYELPFFRRQRGFIGKMLGGWQVNSFFNFQSGAPFSPLNGSDPAGVGSAGIRPNVFTNLDLSGMTVADLYRINKQLMDQARARAQQIFDSLPTSSCGWFPVPLPTTIFSAPRGRVICGPQGRSFVVEFTSILEGQRVGNAGRNILRSDNLRTVDIGFIKNTDISESVRAQVWVDLFNAFNWRNFGVPSGVMTDPNFLNKWATDGGSRRIRFGARLVF